MDVLQYIGSIGGIAGVLAFVIFLMYRHDKQSSEDRLREDRKFMEDRLSGVLNDYHITLAENTKALAELTTLLIRLNGRLK